MWSEGAGTHYDARGFEEGGSTYSHDDDFTHYPSGRYSTEVYTELLVEFMESGKNDGKPFLCLVAAYTSPHWPLQVPRDYVDLYARRYDDGYDALREMIASLKEAGIIPRVDAAATQRRHQALGRTRRRGTPYQARKMELYAAMVDNLDDHVGRLLAYLEESDRNEDTLVIFQRRGGRGFL